jgi:hypothetical protein
MRMMGTAIEQKLLGFINVDSLSSEQSAISTSFSNFFLHKSFLITVHCTFSFDSSVGMNGFFL